MQMPDTFAPRFQVRALNSASVSALATTLLCSFPASAASPAEAEQASSWGLGLGAVSKQKPYAGFERETKAVPMLQFENRYIRVFGPGLEVKLPGLRFADTHKLDFGLVGRYDLSSGYEDDDAPILAGMKERKSGFWIGAKGKWENGLANVTAEWIASRRAIARGSCSTSGSTGRGVSASISC